MYRQSSLLRSVLRPGETTPRHRQKMTDLAPRTPAVPVPYAESVEGVPYTKIRELGEIAMAMDGVLRLYFGESTLGTRRFIVDAAVRALREGFTFYSENAGLPGLRGAIARQYSALHGLDVDPASQIVVTAAGVAGRHPGRAARARLADLPLAQPALRGHPGRCAASARSRPLRDRFRAAGGSHPATHPPGHPDVAIKSPRVDGKRRGAGAAALLVSGARDVAHR